MDMPITISVRHTCGHSRPMTLPGAEAAHADFIADIAGRAKCPECQLAHEAAAGDLAAILARVLDPLRAGKAAWDEAPLEALTITRPDDCPWRGRERGCDLCESKSGRVREHLNHPRRRRHVDSTACLVEVRRRRLLTASRLPVYAQGRTFATARLDAYNREVYAELAAWTRADGRGWFIVAGKSAGNPEGNGTGKSWLLHCLTNRLIEQGVSCLYRQTSDLCTEIASTFGGNGDRLEAIIHRHATVPVLLLDEFGKQPAREWATQNLFAVVNAREGLPTVYASNREVMELEAQFGPEFGPAITSRLLGSCAIRTLGGPDRRLTGGPR